MLDVGTNKESLSPTEVLQGDSPLVLVARLKPVAGLDRFQPAGFPEVGHVIYKAPRGKGIVEDVCIVDSSASMANHLESVCLRGAHDLELVDDLAGMPYLRCVTGTPDDQGKLPLDKREVVVTSLTEGHRIASTYFLGQRNRNGKWDEKSGRRVLSDNTLAAKSFGDELADDSGFGIKPDPASKNAHPPAEKWWDVFRTIFKYDANALVHGVLFPQWQIKIPRVLTAHLEAFGASRVDRSGVKFDRLGKTTSGQPIFAVDDAVAREIRATFVLDLHLVRSFGRQHGDKTLGLSEKQKEFIVALALWKIQKLLEKPFRYRSGCHLQLDSLKQGEADVALEVDIKKALEEAKDGFATPPITDVYWPRDELYRPAKEEGEKQASGDSWEDAEDTTETDDDG